MSNAQGRARGALERGRQLAGQFYVLAAAALGAVAVLVGLYEPARQIGPVAVIAAALVYVLAAIDVRQRVRGQLARRKFAELEGPVLWVVGAWIFMRLWGPEAGHVTPLVGGLLAWLWATFPRRVSVFAIGVALTLDVVLTAFGHQGIVALALHAVLFSAMAYGLTRMARGEAFRRQVEAEAARQAQKAHERSKAQDLGLATAQLQRVNLPLADALVRPTMGQETIDFVLRSEQLQLELLREALGLRAAVLLWRDPVAGELRVHAFAGDPPEEAGPYPAGAGLPSSVLREKTEVAVAPARPDYAGLPYLRDAHGVGAAMGIPVLAPDDSGDVAGVLCVDRTLAEPWAERERRALRLAAQKLSLDVETGQRLRTVDHERSTIGRFAAALQRLNGAQDLEQAAEAATEAARALVNADLAVLSVVEGDTHRVVRAVGRDAERFADLRFGGEEGLVGQAVKHRHALPSTPYRGRQAVFTANDKLGDMRALRVVPLIGEEDQPIGALTVAARAEGAFDPDRRAVLDVVARQVAIKIDLARAYDRIHDMATTDGLTGLTNHRTFQQAFDQMLKRAERTSGPLCFILTDIDNFGAFNKKYGVQFGDEVLRGVARVFSQAVRQVDLAARYGGEELCVILEGSDADGGALMAERIRADVEALRFRHGAETVGVTLSLGVASFPADARAKADLVQRADEALRCAKTSGKNRAIRYDEMPPSEVRTGAARDSLLQRKGA